MKRNVYQVITDRIVDSLEKGTVPWQKPWGGKERHPKSLVSGRDYRGINTFLLAQGGYESPYWLTYKQAVGRGGNVRRGEKGMPCIYWNWFEKKDSETGEIANIPFLKYYTVFNVSQCDQVPSPKIETATHPHSPIDACEQVIAGMPNPPETRHGTTGASYSPLEDMIRLPSKESFHNPEFYYSSRFHEMVHATGHESRLARSGIVDTANFASDPYCREELVAEMGSAFLSGYTGIENIVIDNSAAYIDSWLGRLNQDNKLVVTAGAQAQKAADYVLGNKPTYSQ